MVRGERITPPGVSRGENEKDFLEEEVCETGLEGCCLRSRKDKKGTRARENSRSKSGSVCGTACGAEL